MQILLTLLSLIALIHGKIHTLEVVNDVRKYIPLTKFGFLKGGILEVHLENFKASPHNESMIFGFSLGRTQNDGMPPYSETRGDKCVLLQEFRADDDTPVIYFNMDLKNKILHVYCSLHWKEPVNVFRNFENIPEPLLQGKTHKQHIYVPINYEISTCNIKLPITVYKRNNTNYYNTSFLLFIKSELEAGLYNLYFHSCPNYQAEESVSHDFKIEINEVNNGNYLSAGETQLPALYYTTAALFFLLSCFWVSILRQSKHPVFKIHYLMAALVLLKALSLTLQSVNYYYIERLGVDNPIWATVFHIAHLLKGALLFATLILIGAGWTIIKPSLALKDKVLLMLIIPLQLLSNVAEIKLEAISAPDFNVWRNTFIIVDLICCTIVFLPLILSLRHLRKVSRTAAALNLRKHKIYRHFFIMIVFYLYITRIVVYLLKITLSFESDWLIGAFREAATYVFFILTGYKFRPASLNPYLSVPDEERNLDIN